MAVLNGKDLHGIVAGLLDVDRGGRKVDQLPMLLDKEIVPVEMPTLARNGFESQLAARTLLWSEPNIGVVVQDEENLYHGITTNIPRQEFGIKVSSKLPFKSTVLPINVVELVALPKVTLLGSRQRKSKHNPCMVDFRQTSHIARTHQGDLLRINMKEAYRDWNSWFPSWHTRYITLKKKDQEKFRFPRLPKQLRLSFVKLTSELLGIEETAIAFTTKADEKIDGIFSIDLYSNSAEGHSGFFLTDLRARLTSKNLDMKTLPASLTIMPGSFRGETAVLDVLDTAIHEGAHYRHHMMALSMVKLFRKSRVFRKVKGKPIVSIQSEMDPSGKITSMRQLPNTITPSQIENLFKQFLNALIIKQTVVGKGRKKKTERKKLSNVEKSIILSAMGFVEAGHPIVQCITFMAMYPQYPPVYDVTKARVFKTLWPQKRFEQLVKGAGYWGKNSVEQHVKEFTLQLFVDYANTDNCIKVNLLECTNEWLRGPTTKADRIRTKFIEALNKQLTK